MSTEINKTKQSALVVCSGGLDSVTALYWAQRRYKRVEVITFDYGSNHNKRERAALRRTCANSGTSFTIVSLPLGMYFKSALLSGADKIPEGDYAVDNMKSTVVPFRNGIMLSFAAGFAESNGFGVVILGNHGGDHFIYPDCRPDFIASMNAAIMAGTDGAVEIVSPFCNMSKADIIKEGACLGVDFGITYSCYKGGEKHCGVCGTCKERKESFIMAGVKDPTEYEQ